MGVINQDYKWPVGVTFTLPASTEKVWEVITTPGILEKTHPFCEKNPVQEWPGVGSIDAVHYYNGRVLVREFYSWEENLGYDLLIGREGGGKSKVTWRITEVDSTKSKLNITIFPSNLQSVPAYLAWVPYLTTVKPKLKKYLQSVLGGFAYFIDTGKPVVKNQFGTHEWFSN